jgi:signal transduction histidine kinase
VPPPVLESVLTGLVENSRQAGASCVSIIVQVAAGFVELALRDDGPGIPAGVRDRIFKPFFTSRRASGGTGLGLPIIRSLLQAHHGTIRLAQDDGAGATFLVTLPAYAAMPT